MSKKETGVKAGVNASSCDKSEEQTIGAAFHESKANILIPKFFKWIGYSCDTDIYQYLFKLRKMPSCDIDILCRKSNLPNFSSCHYLNFRNNKDMLCIPQRIKAFRQEMYIAVMLLFLLCC
jgi:hypothetical protein